MTSNSRNLIASLALLAIAAPHAGRATDALMLHDGTLRADPSARQAPVATLEKDQDVEILDATPQNNYLHVRTAEHQEGWVYAKNLEMRTAVAAPQARVRKPAPAKPKPAGAQPAPTAPLDGIVTDIPGTWDAPVPAETTFEGPDGTCGPTGDGGDTFTNLRKNRTDVPKAYHEVSWSALQALPYPVAGRSLDEWTPDQVAQIKPYEGVAVTVTGFITAVKVQSHGSGESTNCHFVNEEEVDWHVPLVQNARDGEDTSIVVETTPRVRQAHPKWTPQALSPWVKSEAPVRISGWTLLDPEHRAHLGKYRSTLWEVHPITRIEVFQDGQWVDLDTLP